MSWKGGRMSTILIVDDEPTIVSLLELILRSKGHQIYTAGNAGTALDIISEQTDKGNAIEILVSDVQMPGMDGLELINQVNHLYPDISAIAITGYRDSETVVQLLKAGCREYVAKPFSEKEISATVNKIITEQKRRNEHINKVLEVKNREIAKLVSDFTTLKTQVKGAVISYEELLAIDTDSIPFDFCHKVRPLADIGGDLLTVGNRPDGTTAILIADVAGHDMSASYHAVLMKTLFYSFCETEKEPSLFFQSVNNVLVTSGKQRMITAQLLIVDRDNMKITLTNAAHPPMIHWSSEKKCASFIELPGEIIGILPDAQYNEISVPYSSGDEFLLYTDGIIELRHTEGKTGKSEMLTSRGLLNIYESYASLPLHQRVETTWNDLLNYSRYKIDDDLMMVGISLKKRDENV